jgi:diguanylate cyclase (GGDEF)-like protein
MTGDSETAARLRPGQIFFVVVAVTFASEVAVMLILEALPIRMPNWLEAVADATLLTVLLGPTLYFFLFRPIAAGNQALLKSERELRMAQAGIEARISERTLELNDAIARQSAQHERLARLSEGTQMLHACRDIAEIGKVVAAQLSLQFGDVAGAFYVYRASRDAIVRVASWNAATGTFADTIAAGDCWALRRGRLHLGGSAPGQMHCDGGACRGAHTVCLPLAAGGDAIGLITLLPASDPETTPLAGLERTDWQILLSAFRESVAVAVSNVRLRESLREQALRDQLTGLFNRRFIDEALKIGLAQAKRRGEPYSAAMIDVDHFKKFNDTCGHEAGDLVLSALGAHFQRHLRNSDIACRYGGEEFLILLPATDGDAALAVLEKLCRSVEALAVRIDATRQVCVTISAGIATFPAQGENADALLRSADGALYESKRAGRNRVTRAPALQVPAHTAEHETRAA